MTITITSTDEIADLGIVQCRVWAGVTPGGVPFKALLAGVFVHKGADASEFKELELMAEAVEINVEGN
jgi:hypothetical protein